MEQLGLNLVGIIAQIINFGIVFLVLKKFVFGPLLIYIKDQQKREKETEEKRAAIEKEWSNINKIKEKEIAQAQKEGQQIIEAAKKEAEKMKKKILEEAKEEAHSLIISAQKEIENQKNKMTQEVLGYTTDLAVKIASKLIADIMDKEKQKVLIRKSILKLKKNLEVN